MKVCFFGASVCEQTNHHDTGDITGFITYMENNMCNSVIDEIVRVTSGSSTINDAGVAYVSKVVSHAPDVCILDWTTPFLSTCDDASIHHIYSELLNNNIVPITIVFPRTDREQSSTDITNKLRQFTESYKLPFYDLSIRFGKELIEQLLRDSVHTNSFGAMVYGDYIFNVIKEVNLSITDYKVREPLNSPYFVSELSTDSLNNKVTHINLKIKVLDGLPVFKFILLLEQRVGPWSGILDVEINGIFTQKVNNFDPWCYRERQCIKPISELEEVKKIDNEILVTIKVSDNLPNYGSLTSKCDFENYRKEIRPKGLIYCISSHPVSLSL